MLYFFKTSYKINKKKLHFNSNIEKSNLLFNNKCKSKYSIITFSKKLFILYSIYNIISKIINFIYSKLKLVFFIFFPYD